MSLSFRRILEQDLEKIAEWRMSPEVTKYMYTNPKITMKDQLQWFERISTDEKVSYWLIVFGGVEIGVINLYDIDLQNRRCFWAYYIGDNSVRGKGLGRGIECNIYDHVFFKLALNKLSCEVLSFNQKVVDIHKHFGSKVEGLLRQHIYKEGKFLDVVRMAILKEEWKEMKNSFEYEKVRFED